MEHEDRKGKFNFTRRKAWKLATTLHLVKVGGNFKLDIA